MTNEPESPDEQGAGRRRNHSASQAEWRETAVLLARLTGVGWYVAGSIGGGAAGGWLLDRWLGTQPVLTLIGLALGVTVAFTGMFRLLGAAGKKRR